MNFDTMNDGKIKVLNITGAGRSGSTILCNILAQIDGIVFMGELARLGSINLYENRYCGCGVPFAECEVWMRVLDEAFGGLDQIDFQEMIDLGHRRGRVRHIPKGDRIRNLPLMLMPGAESRVRSRQAKYLSNLEKLFRAIHNSTNSTAIVDSSKFPGHGYKLGLIPSIDPYFLHLVRDSRAHVFSWQRKKLLQPGTADPTHMRQFSPVETAIRWVIRNVAAEAFCRRKTKQYLFLRYEDFVDQPQAAVKSILDLIGKDSSTLPFVAERMVELEANHVLFGNPSRFNTGRVELRLDEAWKREMRRKDKLIVTALTWPWLAKYGYSSRTGL
jgi:hypothetical protein